MLGLTLRVSWQLLRNCGLAGQRQRLAQACPEGTEERAEPAGVVQLAHRLEASLHLFQDLAVFAVQALR